MTVNDNDKFRKFFGFGGDKDTNGSSEGSNEPVLSEKEQLDKANGAVAEWAEKYLSLTADFQNYKKRVTQERTDWAHDAQKQVIVDLLTVIDNFERALEQEKKREETAHVSWLAGFEMIYQSLEKLLTKFGVQQITDFSVFNPKYHEALLQVESDKHKSGEIVQVLQKGYTMHDKVIRPAIVSVAK
ncbi:MAG TPA: nucleotide exchange factor GrpE [Candidatus Babeliales bacterium]|jgi:molecular chaperone GrpE|nr:nucleotide exchange factor GrpE [Candidatus Babeliales bacterium]